MELVDARKLQLQQQHLQQHQQEHQHFHVLAVDDSVIDRKLLERLLRGSSCKVTCVDSGDKALKYLGLINNDDLDDNSSTSLESSSSPPDQPLQQEYYSMRERNMCADWLAKYGSSMTERLISWISCPPALSSTLLADAMEIERGIKVNLIMTDYCMPGMSGYDLLKRVKGSSWKDVPVVIMSSENVPSRITMCMEGGADEFLLKPLQLSDLEKLQPYFLKSLDNNSCDDQEESANSSIDYDNDNNILINNNSNNIIDNNNSISKRKAMSPEPPERSRPKMKGLAVV